MTVFTWGLKSSAGIDSEKDQLVPTELPIYGPSKMDISLIATGVLHSLIVVDGSLYAFGSGKSGQLGTGNFKSYPSPRKVLLSSSFAGKKIISVAAGAKHSLIVFEDGSVYGFGSNFNAQFGYNFDSIVYKGSHASPVRVNFSTPQPEIVSVAAGKVHSLFLTKDGNVYSVGEGFHGQLGLYFDDGTERVQEAPRLIDTFPSEAGPIVKIIAGDYTSAAITGKGELFVWGLGFALGMTKDDILHPKRVTLDEENDAVKDIQFGPYHSVILSKGGLVYTMGLGSSGQLGNGSLPIIAQKLGLVGDLVGKKVVHIGAGERFCLAVTDENKIWIWGKDTNKSLTASTVSSLDSISGNGGLKEITSSNDSSQQKVFSGFPHENANDRLATGNGNNTSNEDDQTLPNPTLLQFDLKGKDEFIKGVYCGGWHILVETNGPATVWGTRQDLLKETAQDLSLTDEKLTSATTGKKKFSNFSFKNMFFGGSGNKKQQQQS